MKNTNKRKVNIDALAEVRKSPNFSKLAKNADARIRLASEVYICRRNQGLSQTALAKKINSTQKVVSKIESGDINIGFELLNRIIEELSFTSINLSRIFSCCVDFIDFNFIGQDSGTYNSNALVEADPFFHKSNFTI